jgi:hypothetical protein
MISSKNALANVNNYLQFATNQDVEKNLALFRRGNRIYLTGYQNNISGKVHDLVIKFLTCFGFFTKVSLRDRDVDLLSSDSYSRIKAMVIEKKYLFVYVAHDEFSPIDKIVDFRIRIPESLQDLVSLLRNEHASDTVRAYLVDRHSSYYSID